MANRRTGFHMSSCSCLLVITIKTRDKESVRIDTMLFYTHKEKLLQFIMFFRSSIKIHHFRDLHHTALALQYSIRDMYFAPKYKNFNVIFNFNF
jgi:hypothetical protein